MTDQPASRDKHALSQSLLQAIRGVLVQARSQLQQTVNHTMVQTYWQLGRLIVEHEQQGKARAEYGKQQLQTLSEQLTTEFGRGFDVRNLRNMRAFYLAFPKRNAVRTELSWTHYRRLIRIDNLKARDWYMQEAIDQNWSARALDRQVSKLYYERLLSSKDRTLVQQEAEQVTRSLATGPEHYLRDPYVLDFLNLPYDALLENKLEQALINNLQQFLLELGKGFAFVGRQQRISMEDQDFYIDLVFYNFKLKCFLLIDLKLGKLCHQDEANFEEIEQSIVAVKDHLDLLRQIFHQFDSAPYFTGEPIAQLNCLNMAAEYAMQTEKLEKRFMALVKRLKAAYDVCYSSDRISQDEKDHIHFYMAVRSIIFKLTHGTAPDNALMNARVKEMLAEAIKSDGVEEIFKLGEDGATEIDLFDVDYLDRIDKIKLPNTKIQLLKKLLAKALSEFKKTNKVKAVDFSKRFQSLVEKYNERKEEDAFTTAVHNEAINGLFDLMADLKTEMGSFEALGISLEEKAFYDILKKVAEKYEFTYEEDRLLDLAAKVKAVVDDKAQFPDWNHRGDIKASLRVELIMLLSKHGYSPVTFNEVYQDVFEQAEHFKAGRGGE
ncbi:PDDEXK nuclease domain-containing protein [Endozoicomonas sp. YOMI1]|uniref:PDDEXK nuclease domain-containing protein n=1 Tax=Endozoicomonas sp. YOMI1 TaxID=2828739 RepID=UPI0021476F0D|nr:PDDEXK nuclease domain-containing protein [Endozoicomonas sp. YOMI1]